MRGRLAILTVVRDDLPGLLATRASLRAQGSQDFDWIVVDGASVDGTAAWLAAHAGELAWWRSAPDRGLYDAMNVALGAATANTGASHVLFLNAGDTLAGPDTAGRIADAIARTPRASLIYGDALERLADGRIVAKLARSHRLAVFGMFTHHQAMVYRREDVADLRFDLRYALAADYAFTLEVLRRGTAARLAFPLCVFAPGGRSQQDAARGRSEQAEIRREMMGHGTVATAMFSGIQWLALTLRRHVPGLYAKLRFRPAATSFLS